MKNVINPIGNVAETRSGNDGVSCNAVTTDGQGGDEREVVGSDQGGVALQLDQLSRAYQNGSEFQYGKTLPDSCGHRGFHIEKCNFRALFTWAHQCWHSIQFQGFPLQLWRERERERERVGLRLTKTASMWIAYKDSGLDYFLTGVSPFWALLNSLPIQSIRLHLWAAKSCMTSVYKTITSDLIWSKKIKKRNKK